MSNEISSDSEAIIEQLEAQGVYRDRTDAIEADVELLRQHPALFDELDEGRRQLSEGEYVEFDQEGLRLFFESLKDQARRRTEIK
jgi:hypothetical protein